MVELAIIKQLDEKMTAELERDRAAKRINPSEFKAKVVKLLIQIAQAADRVTAIEDYSWLDTAATRWLRAGIDVRTVQSWLGHESLDTTQKYLEPSKETERQLSRLRVPCEVRRVPAAKAATSSGTSA